MSFKIGPDVEDWDGVNQNVKSGVGSIVEFLRNEYGIDPFVTSGKRSAANNANVGGAENSYHLTGDAADLYIGDIDDDVAEKIRQHLSGQGWGEVLYHDAGSGRHLHVANLKGNIEAAPAITQHPVDMDMSLQDFLLPADIPQEPSFGDSLLQLAQEVHEPVQQDIDSVSKLYSQIEQIASYVPPQAQANLLQQQYEVVSNMARKNAPQIDPRTYAEYFTRLKRKYLV